MTDDLLAGVWRLVSAHYQDDDGNLSDMLGPQPRGLLVYTSDGHMSVQMMRTERPAATVGDLTAIAPADKGALFDGYRAYAGTYVINRDERTVIHRVQVALPSAWVSTDIVRNYEIAGDSLRLRVPRQLRARGGAQAGVVSWQRVA